MPDTSLGFRAFSRAKLAPSRIAKCNSCTPLLRIAHREMAVRVESRTNLMFSFEKLLCVMP